MVREGAAFQVVISGQVKSVGQRLYLIKKTQTQTQKKNKPEER